MLVIRAILFDLGGVLIRLRGHRVLLDYLPAGVSDKVFLTRWLHSPSVRQFESGRMTLPDFCRAAVTELGLEMTEDQFLLVFQRFLDQPYEGPDEVLPRLMERYITGVLSNTSETHWEMATTMLPVLNDVHHRFLSCRLGLLKPDADIFEEVLRQLKLQAGEVLYFDDHPANVAAARELGIQAVAVDGFGEAVEAMTALGLLIP